MNIGFLRNITAGQIFRLVRFGLVGGFTFVFYYLLLICFVELNLLSISFASAVAYIIAVGVNYALHYFWTFESDSSHKVVAGKYIVMVTSGFSINLLCMTYLIPNDGSYYLQIQAVVLFGIIIWNYLLSTFWVFKKIR